MTYSLAPTIIRIQLFKQIFIILIRHSYSLTWPIFYIKLANRYDRTEFSDVIKDKITTLILTHRYMMTNKWACSF